MLASIVTVPSNGFVIRAARSPWRFQAITKNRVGLLSVVKSNDNNVTVYDDNFFSLLIALSDAIKKIVVLSTFESSNNSIQ